MDLQKRQAKWFDSSVVSYGVEKDEKTLKAVEMWISRRLEKISWMGNVSNEELLRSVGGKQGLLETEKRRKRKRFGHLLTL